MCDMLDLGPWPEGFRVHLHLPDRLTADMPVLVSVHGISRNAHEHIAHFKAASDGRAVILCPGFSAEFLPHYQRLGIGKPELRADLLLDAALERVALACGLTTGRMHLFGFSGGAQFAHRYAMLYPHRVRALHLAAAGHYTFLAPGTPWPRGCRGGPGPQILANKAHFLRLPIHLYVGEHDHYRDDALRKGPKIDRQQGENRMERACTWHAHISTLRQSAGPDMTFETIASAGHDFAEACQAGDDRLAARVMRRVEAREAVRLAAVGC